VGTAAAGGVLACLGRNGATGRVVVVTWSRGTVVDDVVLVVSSTGTLVVVVVGRVLAGKVGGLPNAGGRDPAAAAGRSERTRITPVTRTSRTEHAAVERRHRPRRTMGTQLTTESIDTIGPGLYHRCGRPRVVGKFLGLRGRGRAAGTRSEVRLATDGAE
jgi:hypothetical protein